MQSNTPYSIGGEPALATPRRRIPLPIKLLMPAFLAVGIVVILPLLFSFYTSFTAYRLTDPDTLSHWIGWRNYERAFANGDFWAAFGRTILFLTVALNLELLLGLGVALLLNQVTRGQRALRTVMMFPMMFSPVLVGFQFKFMLNDSTGIVNNLMPVSRQCELRARVADRGRGMELDTDLRGDPARRFDGVAERSDRSVEGGWLYLVADLSLCNAAVPDAVHLYLHDDPFSRCGPSLRHRADHDEWRSGWTHGIALDHGRTYCLRRLAHGLRQRNCLCLGARVHPLHAVLLPQVKRRAQTHGACLTS
jgi:hypothetical protein